MPQVRKPHATFVHGRVQRSQRESTLPSEQRGDREREGHREAHVAEVQHRRMDDHPRILQQRIEVAAFAGGGQQAFERIAGEQQEREEAHRDQAHHAQHARDHGQGQALREARDGGGPQRQDQGPQQQRALVRAPHRGVAVDPSATRELLLVAT
jgi:hypothetical protein